MSELRQGLWGAFGALVASTGTLVCCVLPAVMVLVCLSAVLVTICHTGKTHMTKLAVMRTLNFQLLRISFCCKKFIKIQLINILYSL